MANAVAVLERERMSLVEGSKTTGAQGEAALHNRVESLRQLALALLKQVESLEEAGRADRPSGIINLYEEVRRFETDIIRRTLLRTGGNQSRAARLLGIKVTTLNTKIKRYHIQYGR